MKIHPSDIGVHINIRVQAITLEVQQDFPEFGTVFSVFYSDLKPS